MTFNSKVYQILKFVALILLPAAGSLYFALAGIWHLPAAEQVIGTITAVDAFLGVLLGISTVTFNKHVATGTMNLSETAAGKTYLLEVHGDPEYELPGKKELRLKVASHKTATRRK